MYFVGSEYIQTESKSMTVDESMRAFDQVCEPKTHDYIVVVTMSVVVEADDAFDARLKVQENDLWKSALSDYKNDPCNSLTVTRVEQLPDCGE